MRQIFGEWKPDQPAHLQDGLVRAHGVVPIANGYAPLPSFSPAPGGALPAACIGAGAYRTSDDVYVFAATATAIYRYGGAGHVAIKTGLSSSPAIGVRFCPFNRLMLATNGVDPIHKFDPSTPTGMTALAASAPTARFLAVVRGFVVAGYVANDALRVAWSDNGDPATWTAGTGEAGFQAMSSGGDITGVVGGEYGLVFQENRVVRMTYTADDAIWQFDEIATDIGCIAPWSLATYGKLTFFLSNKGFMACDGVTVEAIGIETVDRAFLSMLDRTYLERMSAAVDPRSSTYIVSVPSANPATEVYLYHFALRRWTTASLTAERIFPALSQSVSLDALDASYGSIDATGLSIDSAALRGGYPLLMLFDGSHRLGTLSGPNMAATLIDGLKELVPGGKARIRSVRPLTDAAATIITLLGADGLSDSLDETVHETRTPAGVHRMRRSCSFCSAKLSVPAGTAWTYAQGYDVDFAPGGRP
jgi:hypothetical protein